MFGSRVSIKRNPFELQPSLFNQRFSLPFAKATANFYRMKFFAHLLGLALVAPLCAEAALSFEQLRLLPPPATHPINFATEIKPLLEARCLTCHGHGRSKGEFRIDSRETILKGGDTGAAIVEGKSAESYFIELVSGIDPDNVMPKKGTKLTREEVGLLRAWIDQGAKWDANITFSRPEPLNLKPRRPELPASGSKAVNPIDRLLAPYFAANKFKPGKPVGDRLFARRVYLDVVGLLPPADELEHFISDKDRDKRAKLVHRLLADDENYAQNWLSFWNDLLRNDYKGTGYIDGGRKQISQWLYTSLETNKPYDRFVAELVNPTKESEGFAKGIVWRGAVNASQKPHMQAAQNISQVFMGVNLKCASCHDSFINDWTLADAYNLASVYADGPVEMVHCDKPTGKMADPRFIYAQLGELEVSTNKAVRLESLARLITQREDGRLTRTLVNRFWQKFFGRGLVEPVDDMEKPAWNSDVLDWLAEDFADHGYDVRHLIAVMLNSRAYQMPTVPATEQTEAKFVFEGPQVRRMSAEQFRDAIGLLTDSWYKKPATKILNAAGETNQSPTVRAALVEADSLQIALGRPNREQVVTVRSPTATTLQALELTNGSELAALIKHGADKNIDAAKGSSDALVKTIYQLALCRPPTPTEFHTAKKMVGTPAQTDSVEDLLWALTMLPEFQLIY